MSDQTNIDWLREKVRQLKALLDDPQPGLSSWHMMYEKRMQDINDFWASKYEPSKDKIAGHKL